MAVEVMAWNVLDAFSDEQRARAVLDVVAKERPAAAVFPEAYAENKESLLDDVVGAFHEKGYQVVHGPYNDDDGRYDCHGIMGIVRNTVLTGKKPHIMRIGSRNAVRMPLVDPENGIEHEFVGVHLDDRSEQRRLGQVAVLLADTYDRTIIAGDLNAMRGTGVRARTLQTARPLACLLPAVDPRPDYRPPKLKRVGSLAQRLTAMATGTTLQAFEDAGFHDTDPVQYPTKGPFCLDHILYRQAEAVRQYTYPQSPLSDHRAVSARLKLL